MNAEDVFKSPEGVEAHRNGMYSNLSYDPYGAFYSFFYPVINDFLGEDMVYGDKWFTGLSQIYNYQTSSTSDGIDILWIKAYFFIEIANTMIEAEIDVVPEEQIKQYKAEAYALRAMVHMDLCRFFGKAYHLDNGESKSIPYIDKIDYTYLPYRDLMKVIYSKAIADLKKAIPDLPVSKGNEYYMNANAANALLARIYMDIHEYETARTYAREAIKGVGFMTTDEYKKGLSTVNSESIFTIGSHESQYSQYRSFTSFHDDLDGMGEDFLVNTDLFKSFNNNDIRKAFFIPEDAYWMYYDGNVYEGNTIPASVFWKYALYTKGYTAYGKFPRKDVVIGSDRGTLGLGDYNYIRASEMILTIAECDARLEDNNTEAQNLLFSIQSRSIPGAVKSTSTGQSLVDEILAERRKELFGEGHGLTNIKRLGKGLNRSGSHPFHQIISAEDNKFVWPIPEREANANPNLLE